MSNNTFTPAQRAQQNNRHRDGRYAEQNRAEAALELPVTAPSFRIRNGQTLTSEHPTVAAEWHPTRNGNLTPERVPAGTDHKAWWLCSECGHEWEAQVKSRTRLGRGCPRCHTTRRGTLADNDPVVASQWHPTLNGALTPAMLSVSSSQEVWWRCPAGHSYEASPLSRTKMQTGCPTCPKNRRVVKAGPRSFLAESHPHIAAQWHPTRNGDTTAATTRPSSRDRVWWLCPSGHEYQQRVAHRTGRRGSCPDCRRLRNGTLESENPALAAEWDTSRNGVTASMIAPTSAPGASWWQCSTCGHAWQATLTNRAKGSGCPECARLRGGPLTEQAPELAALWHPTRNGDITAEEVPYGARYEAWWLCPSGHVWQKAVHAQVTTFRNGTSPCPKCRAKDSPPPRVAEVPTLAALWHPTRNDRPATKVSSNGWATTWWRCQTGHDFRGRVRDVADGTTSCQTCAGRTHTNY